MRRLSENLPGFMISSASGWPQMLMISIVLGLVFSVPSIAFTVATIVLIGQFTFVFVGSVFPFSNAEKRRVAPAPSTSAHGVVLSIHVAARNEPPELLIATLASLHRQIATVDHEVIVMINNTPDPALWRPVEHWCHAAGPRFRFVRCDGVEGAKAGALNIALARTSPAATHIVTLDADYQVRPDFLNIVNSEIARSGADFLQFPQAYRHISPRTEGLSLELAEYFTRLARAANTAHAMLLTGTLSVIRRDALDAVGGWPDKSCTEDAELGTVLIAAGYHGVFIDRIVGRGLMPLDLESLHAQRHRWAAGNARVLATVLRSWARGSNTRDAVSQQNILLVAQLSAWLNLGGLALVTLLAGVVHLWLAQNDPAALALAEGAILLSTISIVLILAGAISPILRSTFAAAPLAVRCQALASRIAMVPIAACATLAGFSPHRQAFRVTRKHSLPTPRPALHPHLVVVGVIAVGLLGMALTLSNPLVAIAGGLMLLPLIGAAVSRQSITHYAADVTTGEMEWTWPSAS